MVKVVSRGLMCLLCAAGLLLASQAWSQTANPAKKKFLFQIRYAPGMRYDVAIEASSSAALRTTQDGKTQPSDSRESLTQRYTVDVIEIKDEFPTSLNLTIEEDRRESNGAAVTAAYQGLKVPLSRSKYGGVQINHNRLREECTEEEQARVQAQAYGALESLLQQLDANDELYLPRQRLGGNKTGPLELAIGDTWTPNKETFLRYSGLRETADFQIREKTVETSGTLRGVENDIATLALDIRYTAENPLFDTSEIQVHAVLTIRFDMARNFPLTVDSAMDYTLKATSGPATIEGDGKAASKSTITVQ